MITIKLNNTEFGLENYNRNTYFTGETVESNATCGLATSDIAALEELVPVTITSLQILKDNVAIYELEDISARIANISEYLNGDRISISIGLTFFNT